MNIIRDEDPLGITMFALLIEWGIRRCNVKGCTARPNTIVTGMVKDRPVGFCEEHYQQANKKGGTNYTIVFDDFDAFAEAGAE